MKIGDKVRFISETGGGVVAGFREKNIVLVEDEDGFQIPVRVNDVVVIDSDDYNLKPAAPEPKPAVDDDYDPADPANDYTVSTPNEYYRKLMSKNQQDGRWLMGEDR